MNTPSAFFGHVGPLTAGDGHRPAEPAYPDAIRLEGPTTRLTCFATGPHGLLATTEEEGRSTGAAFLGELYNATALRRELGLPAGKWHCVLAAEDALRAVLEEH